MSLEADNREKPDCILERDLMSQYFCDPSLHLQHWGSRASRARPGSLPLISPDGGVVKAPQPYTFPLWNSGEGLASSSLDSSGFAARDMLVTVIHVLWGKFLDGCRSPLSPCSMEYAYLLFI